MKGKDLFEDKTKYGVIYTSPLKKYFIIARPDGFYFQDKNGLNVFYLGKNIYKIEKWWNDMLLDIDAIPGTEIRERIDKFIEKNKLINYKNKYKGIPIK